MGLELPQAQLMAGALNQAGNVASTILTNRANMKLAQYGYEQERQMIAEQNAYNSPVEQIKRYQEAGLNPNLIYGNGVSSAGNQQSIAHYNAPSLDAPQIDLNNIIPMMLTAKKEQTAIQNMSEQTELLNRQVLSANQDYLSKLMDNAFKADILGFNPGLILTKEEMDKIHDSKMVKRYDADTRRQETASDLAEAQKHFQNLSSKEKDYFITNIQPLIKDYQKHLAKYEEHHATIEEVDASFEKRLMQMGVSGKGAQIFVQLLRAFIK